MTAVHNNDTITIQKEPLLQRFRVEMALKNYFEIELVILHGSEKYYD